MDLPVTPPVLPWLAKAVKSVPTDGGFSFEPKFDRFTSISTSPSRAIVR